MLWNLVEYGEKQQIFENPTHPYTKLLIYWIPSVDPENIDKKAEITTKVVIYQTQVGVRFLPGVKSFPIIV